MNIILTGIDILRAGSCNRKAGTCSDNENMICVIIETEIKNTGV